MEMSRFALLRLALAVISGLGLMAAPTAEAGNYFKFFWSDPDEPPPVVALPPHQVREVLKREGVRMIGAPRLLGSEIIAYGREPSGAERKFTLDAETGRVLTVTLSRAAPDRPLPRINANAAPGRPLGPPTHLGGLLDADHLGTPPPPAPPEQVVPPPPPKPVEAPPVSEMDMPTVVVEAPGDHPDRALSPIKPLKPPPGAPKVEKLPR
jgi:hypothetical protein